MNILGENIGFNDYNKALKHTTLGELKKLNDKELEHITKVLTTEAKRRKTRLRNSKSVNGTNSPAYRKYSEQLWNVPKTREKQLEQIRQVKDFIKDKTSTVKGIKEYNNQIRKTFNEKFNTKLSDKSFNKLTNILTTLEGSYDWYNISKKYDSEREITEIIKMSQKFKNKSDEEIINILSENYTYNYEMEQWRNNGQTFEEPEVPETLKELYPKKWAKQQDKKEKEENNESDEDNSNITKDSLK